VSDSTYDLERLASRLATREAKRSLATLALFLAACLGGVPVAHADAGMHTFRLEGGVAFAVTSPQASRFDVGGGGALSYELRPIPWLGIEARIAASWLPSSGASPTPQGFGSYYAPGLGLRIHPLAGLGVGDLWISAVGAVVFTGDVVRPGLEAAIGYEFDVTWWLRIGPYVRYQHVFQTVPGADAGFISIGLSFAFGGDEPSTDRDQDGILDHVDGCPDDPEDIDTFEDADGCPDPDNDADAVLDRDDGCPMVAEDRDGFEDDDGCADPDNDQDGVPDASDGCPLDAEDRDGFEDADGCPELDNDGDGIPDAADQCVNEPETPNGIDDADGCPDTAPTPPTPEETETEIRLDQLGERIHFVRGRVRIVPSSRAALAAVIALLQEHPDILRVTIEAHASEEGDADDNMALSERRAEAVVEALVAGGVDRSRLVARAYGELRPEVQQAETEEEHATNRRVVFFVERAVPAR
jgi:outer membrane protein OmpA-like peptidoglycan-associated protein